MPENHRRDKGDLLPLARPLSAARLEMLGKPKPLSRAQGLSLSLSTIGRILARLVRLKRIRPAAFDGRAGQAQRRQFQRHAKRWQ